MRYKPKKVSSTHCFFTNSAARIVQMSLKCIHIASR